MSTVVLILAAGLGTRMKSKLAKVLHHIAGRPLIRYVYEAALSLFPERIIVVVGHQAEDVKAYLNGIHNSSCSLEFALQSVQRGTADAVAAAKPLLVNYDGIVAVLSGDVPLLSPPTLNELKRTHMENAAAATILSTEVKDPTGYGRIIRNQDGSFCKIVEHRDATELELGIREINTGIYCFDSKILFELLDAVTPQNAQNELYLTDIPKLALATGRRVCLLKTPNSQEVLGINDRSDLVTADRILRMDKCHKLLLAGVTILNPETTYIDLDVTVGQDSYIYPGVRLEGKTIIGQDCTIGTGARLTNCILGNNVTVKDYSIICDSTLDDGVSVGPFAHIRMGAHLQSGAAIGNFVEVKKSSIGKNTKAMHLSYLGDATIGTGVNIGAGTITCNYDGKQKHRTIIGDGARIGSDTMLIAPVSVGKNAVTGAGSVVTRDIPESSLAYGVPAEVKKQL
ncbi:MAG: bifunctional UDP-N-acetylglucosamine diphosphorylase/glucosamine-1-phosphate N-acetyltransferase GlmU [Acidobacteriota bacterium]|nr:bifunctional UDP-N-acetylglucosamine diphosphorylase/glucosamine-1-phosphate N-acetyltransferase GlmU [Blastocatellia bacterium]MDW8411775.1 bifunctional UDP-N-acetylglucosamine diphosphorylase/glucosamine-1-phosphate N-acetyltransferase GlmU [Acidobacteriota bacterium]